MWSVFGLSTARCARRILSSTWIRSVMISPNCTVTAPFDVVSFNAALFGAAFGPPNMVFFGVLVVDREARKFKEMMHFHGSSDCESRQWIGHLNENRQPRISVTR